MRSEQYHLMKKATAEERSTYVLHEHALARLEHLVETVDGGGIPKQVAQVASECPGIGHRLLNNCKNTREGLDDHLANRIIGSTLPYELHSDCRSKRLWCFQTIALLVLRDLSFAEAFANTWRWEQATSGEESTTQSQLLLTSRSED